MTTENWKAMLPAFVEKTDQFYAGECSKIEYKGFSGLYGSYAQRDAKSNMLRLRMTGGVITKGKLAFVSEMIRKHDVKRMHYTTCETIQLHDLQPAAVYDIMEKALDAGIVTIGGGGDYPRNVMCSPLSGVEADECFDVMPWAQAAGDYLITLVNAQKMPRKLKVCFSNSPKNLVHATYRDLGFVARPDSKFDVYSAGGLGNNPKFGVLVAEAIAPEDILYYIKAMWLTFLAHGNYENRAKARTRYMQDAVGGAEQYVAAYQEKLKEVFAEGIDMHISPEAKAVKKQGDGSAAEGFRVTPQKQDGLYAVNWHPLGGQPAPADFCALADAVSEMEDVELRLAPDESVYIINLTGKEAEKVMEMTKDSAQTVFETSVACIGAGICQVGLRDSQAMLQACVDAARKAALPNGVLPQIHISGCPSSCGTHQTGMIGLRGAAKVINKVPHAAFALFINGCERQGEEAFGGEVGVMLEESIPAFLVEVGQTVAASGMDFAAWYAKDPGQFTEIAQKYLCK